MNRIENVNNNAFVVGETINHDLGVSLLLNDGQVLQTYFQDRLEGEYRSHAFNFSYIDDHLVTGITTQMKKSAEFEDDEYYWDDNISS